MFHFKQIVLMIRLFQYIDSKNRACIVLTIYLLLSISLGHISAQKSQNIILPQASMAIPASANLNISSSDLEFSISKKEVENPSIPRVIDSVWINYSAVIENNTTHSICANIISSNLPSQVFIKLQIGAYQGDGIGKTGIPAAPIVLSALPQPIVTDIGSCLTGKAEQEGHLLVYTWELGPDFEPGTLNNTEDFWASVIYTLNTEE